VRPHIHATHAHTHTHTSTPTTRIVYAGLLYFFGTTNLWV
jgi:hypothetical protein